MMPIFLAGLGLILAGGVAAALRPGRGGERTFAVLLVAGSALAIVPALAALGGGVLPAIRVPSAMPGGDWMFAIDRLSAVFVIVILGVGAVNALYGLGYLRHGHDPGHASSRTAISHCAFAVLQVSLALVVTAAAVVPFLGAWELMALAGYALIMYEHEEANVRRAGLLYLVATHAGTLALFGMFALWTAGAPNWSFASLALARLPSPGLVAILALAGFGVKAGLVPLHVWLPPAHAAAPSHVSAQLSGIVIKAGIYGLLRVAALLGGSVPAWWGWIVLVLGAASMVLGVLWALAQHDLKRLLAYHSVENVGIILMALGVGVLGVAYDRPLLAALGFAGAVMHTVNHALFKSLLFLGAGSVYLATGTREMDRLGGVGRALPATWLFFLVGSMAIIGVPPLNGFVSEWTIFLALFQASGEAGAVRIAAFGASILALAGGLALACFAKVCGVVFLGVPRDAGIRARAEPGTALTAPMAILAVACLAIGVVPPILFEPALGAAATVARVPPDALGPAVAGAAAGAVRVGQLGVVVLVLAAAAWLARALLRRRAARLGAAAREAETWACGYPAATPRMQYTSSSFAAPLIAAFGKLSGSRAGGTGIASGAHYATRAVDPVLDALIYPAWRRVRDTALRFRTMQAGRLHVYLLYIILTLVALLAYLGVSVRRS